MRRGMLTLFQTTNLGCVVLLKRTITLTYFFYQTWERLFLSDQTNILKSSTQDRTAVHCAKAVCSVYKSVFV